VDNDSFVTLTSGNWIVGTPSSVIEFRRLQSCLILSCSSALLASIASNSLEIVLICLSISNKSFKTIGLQLILRTMKLLSFWMPPLIRAPQKEEIIL
jgi:hypothetical protein